MSNDMRGDEAATEKTSVHFVGQTKGNQRVNRIGTIIATKLGYEKISWEIVKK